MARMKTFFLIFKGSTALHQICLLKSNHHFDGCMLFPAFVNHSYYCWIAKRASTLTMEPTIRVKITTVVLVDALTVQIMFVALDPPIIVRIVTTTFMVSNANNIILSPNCAKR